MKAEHDSVNFTQDEQFNNDCKELGEEGVQEIKESIKWAKDILPEDTYNVLREVGNKELIIGKMIKQFHDAYESKNLVKIPDSASPIVQDVDMKEKAIQMLADPRFKTDVKFKKHTVDLYNKLYG